MSLVLEIEFLTGAYRAAHSPASNTPDWPPQPDRVFSGLVAAWAARGEQSIERLALEWLEARSAPAIHAGDHTVRTAPDVFVPPNDQQATNTERVYLKVMPGVAHAPTAAVPGSTSRRSGHGHGMGGRPGTEGAGGAGRGGARRWLHWPFGKLGAVPVSVA